MPTWNGAAHVREAVQCALAQSHDDFELLVVDDASADATAEVLRTFHDGRLRVHRNETRLGIPDNWNECLRLARGRYVKFLFQDDTLEAHAVARLLSAITAAPGAVLAFARREVRVEVSGSRPPLDGRAYGEAQRHFRASLRGPTRGQDVLNRILLDDGDPTLNVIGEPSFVLLDREAALNAGGFDPSFVQLADWEFWLRLGGLGTLVFVDESLGCFRLHATGQSARSYRTTGARREVVALLTRIRDRYGPTLAPAARRRLRSLLWRYRLRILAGLVRDRL